MEESLRLFLPLIDSMIFSHFAIERDAIVISPSTSLFCAALCATTQPTPPAPICRIDIVPLPLVR
ncbi:Uncharacterised protein [Vibrio cholerae]|nr:Uncharacterised protein [Vibrio cholerae]CSI36910.1 Uncharacterised protein [Vibrio cholerae]